MEYQKIDSKILCRLDVGDEIVDSLSKIASNFPTHTLYVTGIGGCDSVKFSIYDQIASEYLETTINEQVEVTSILGTVNQVNDEILQHIHITFVGSDTQVHGGHLIEANISRTAELMLDLIPMTINRVENPTTKINEWRF